MAAFTFPNSPANNEVRTSGGRSFTFDSTKGLWKNTTASAGATNALPKSGGALTGAVTTNSTFDGRDVAVDGVKLDGLAGKAVAIANLLG